MTRSDVHWDVHWNVVAAVIGAASIAAASQANGLSLTFLGHGPHLNVGIHYEAADSYNAATANSFNNIDAGQLWFSGNLRTFCLQVFEGLPAEGSTSRWDQIALADVPEAPPSPGPMGALKAQLVRDLYARHYSDALLGASESSAFQIVLWELTHENFDESGGSAIALLAQASLTLGAFQLDGNSPVSALAASYLADLGAGGTLLDFGGLYGLTNATYQDLLAVVPIPAPILLAGVGLLGAAALRRRIK